MAVSYKISKRRTLKNFVILFFSTCYALWLSNLPSELFRDRENYLRYARISDIRLKNIEFDFLILFKEPLFLLLNKWLMFLKNPNLTVQVFVFFVCFSLVLFVQKKSKNLFYIFLLLGLIFFNAQSFALQLVTFRQGIGVGLFILFILYFKKYVRHSYLIFFFFVLGLIHISFFLISFTIFIDWFCIRVLKRKELWFRFTVSFAVLLFLNGVVIYSISSLLEAKHQIEGFESTSSGGAFLVWCVVLIYILLFKPKRYNNKIDDFLYIYTITGLILYLTSYFLSPIAGRIIGSYIPFVFYILLYKPKLQDLTFVLLLFIVFTIIFVRGGAEGFLAVPLSTLKQHIIY